MATVDSLSVRVTSQTADANAGLNRVQDNLEEVGDEANSTSRSFGRLSASSGVLQGSFMGLSTVTIATLVPSLLTLSTVIAPLAVVFGGIAAAAASLGAVFGGLALVGVITHTQELKTALQEARVEILQIIEPLGEVFGPLLVDAVEALPSLVQAVVNSLGPLDQFRNTLQRFGETAMRLIPQITSGMFDLAEAALPALNQALRAFESQGPGVFRTLRDVFNQIFPLVVEFSSAVANLLPNILELGTTVANLVVPALTSMVNVLTEVTSRVNRLSPNMSKLAASAVILAPALKVVATVLAGLSTPVLAIVAALGALGVAYHENLFGFRDAVTSTVPSLEQLREVGTATFEAVAEAVSSIEPEIRMLARSGQNALRGFTRFLRTFVAPAFEFVFGRLVGPIINRVAGAFARNLEPILRETSQTITALTSHAKTLGNVMKVVWNTIDVVVKPIVGEIADLISVVLVNAIDIASNSFQLFANLIQGDFSAALQNAMNILGSFTDIALGVPASIIQAFGKGLIGMGVILLEWVQGGADFLMNTASKSFKGLKKGAKFVGGWIGDQVASALDLAAVAVDAVAEMGDAFADGISTIASDIMSLGVDMANTLIEAMNNAIPNEVGFHVGEIEVAGQTVWGGGDVGVDIPNNPIPSAQTGGFIEGAGLLNVHEGEQVVQAAQVTDRGKVETGPSEVVVTLEGDTEVIRDVTTEVVERKERRAKRQTGGSTQI